MSKPRRGFTLVELLAVIVILAVILVIAVPSIMSTITESRKGALASSAKLIASSVETAYISNQTLGIEKDIECRDISNYTDEDYAICSIKFVDGKAQVKIIGNGKFEGMAVCSGTKENAEVVGECPLTAVEKIKSLATESNKEGLATDDFGNIRYAGGSADVKNYVEFGNDNELWRIIGIFKVTTVDETTGEEKVEKLMKIVKDTSIGNYSWDSSASGVNRGYGVNEWSQADLKTELNELYLNQKNGDCYNDKNNSKVACDFRTTGIKDAYRGMIENVVWNTGAITDESTDVSTLERSSLYNAERGTINGKKCTSGVYCNDSVSRTTIWTGKVGLIYLSDYGYASTSGTNISNTAISTTNWLSGSVYWTISPYARSSRAYHAWFVYSSGVSPDCFASDGGGVRPTVYLKSDVSITSGDGSSTDPYRISV